MTACRKVRCSQAVGKLSRSMVCPISRREAYGMLICTKPTSGSPHEQTPRMLDTEKPGAHCEETFSLPDGKAGPAWQPFPDEQEVAFEWSQHPSQEHLRRAKAALRPGAAKAGIRLDGSPRIGVGTKRPAVRYRERPAEQFGNGNEQGGLHGRQQDPDRR